MTLLSPSTLVAGFAIACASAAHAIAINVAAAKDVAAAKRSAAKDVAASTTPPQPARRRRWRGHTKCYQEFATGAYRYHWFSL